MLGAAHGAVEHLSDRGASDLTVDQIEEVRVQRLAAGGRSRLEPTARVLYDTTCHVERSTVIKRPDLPMGVGDLENQA